MKRSLLLISFTFLLTKSYSQDKNLNSAKTSSSSATSCTHFAGSYNVAGIYQGGNEVLQYNKDVNAITFVHGASPTYSNIPMGNSGTIVSKYSINNGVGWDSTVMWTNVSNLARVPQGGIYNPLGNTNIINTYMVGMGPTSSTTSTYNGDWFCSKKTGVAGTTTPGSDQQFFPNTGSFGSLGKKVDFARYGFTYTQDGFVRALGEVCNDINNTSSTAAYGLRGVAIIKGAFIAGSFVWSYDSLIPNCILRSNGSKQLTSNMARMVWNDAGTIGYVVMIGVRAGSTGSVKGYQPIVYKTTNSGASWSLLPQACYNNYHLNNRIWPVNTNSTLLVPNFSTSEGIDAVVDVNNNLHIASTVVGSLSTNNDSLEYIRSFSYSGNMYKYFYGNFGYPTIYDFYTTSAGSWGVHIVDSIGTECINGTNAWNTWSVSATPLDARIQVCHSPDRKKIFYSWTETDSVALGSLRWNMYPNIKMKGYDVTIDKMTPRVDVTMGVTSPSIADASAYFHYMANRSINTSSLTNEIPFTISYNSTYNGNLPVNHYYLKGASFNNSDFTISVFGSGVGIGCSVGINEINKNNEILSLIAYPNPTIGSTTISFDLKENSDVTINVYSTLDSVVLSNKIDGKLGNNIIEVDLSDLNFGVYFYEIKAGDLSLTKKLIIE